MSMKKNLSRVVLLSSAIFLVSCGDKEAAADKSLESNPAIIVADTVAPASNAIEPALTPDTAIVIAELPEIQAEQPTPDMALSTVPNATATTGTSPGKIMIIMDSSGSMWGQINGESKRDIARAALRQMLPQLPLTSDIGLMAYGHRRKGDCGDIEMLSQPKAQNAEALADKVDELRPMGKTPLTAAVRQAADILKIEENKSTIILITDGIETCSADPCATGAELEASGVDFTTHVVGFGLTEQEGRQVACLAAETGGKYFEAANAVELGEALEQVAEVVEEIPEPIVEVPEASVKAPPSAEIGSSFLVEWDGPDDNIERDYIDLVPPGYTRLSGELSYQYTRNGNPATMRAPKEPGTYTIRYIWRGPQGSRAIAETSIEIVDADVVLIAPERIGAGVYFNVEWQGPGNERDYVDLVPAGYTKTSGELSYAYTNQGSSLELQAPTQAGAYELRYIADASDGRRALTTIPLEVLEAHAELAFNPEVSLGQEVEVYWKGPNTKNDYIDLVPRGEMSTRSERSYFYTKRGNPFKLRVPAEPGEYDIRYILQGPEKRFILAREPLSLRDVSASLSFPNTAAAGANLEISWQGPAAKNDYIDIVPRGYTNTRGEKSYAYTKTGNPLSLRLPGTAGEYDVRYILAASNGRAVKAVEPITIIAAEATLTFNGKAKAGETLTITWIGPNNKNDYIDLVAKGSTATRGEIAYAYTKNGSPASIKLPDEPGLYDVRYIMAAVDGRKIVATKSVTVE